jgi:hypothetical protein
MESAMSARNIFTSIALLALLGATVPSAAAAAPGGDDEGRRKDKQSAKYAGPRDEGRPAGSGWRSRAPSPRAPISRDDGGVTRNEGSGRVSGVPYAVPRGEVARDNDQPRSYGPSRGYDESRRGVRDYGQSERGRSYGRPGYSGYDAPRRDNRDYGQTERGRSYGRPGYSGYDGRSGYDNRGGVSSRDYGRGPGYRPNYPSYRYRPYHGPTYRAWYRPEYYYARPYYAFRPRVSIGFGIWIGHPVAFPSYGYAPYPVYGYPSGGYIAIGAARPVYGAVSFEITPFHADLYVDGSLIGRVGDFTPNQPPLTLPAGRHRVEVFADGYLPITFDADVVPGRVIPYRGQMQPY